MVVFDPGNPEPVCGRASYVFCVDCRAGKYYQPQQCGYCVKARTKAARFLPRATRRGQCPVCGGGCPTGKRGKCKHERSRPGLYLVDAKLAAAMAILIKLNYILYLQELIYLNVQDFVYRYVVF